MLSIDDFKRITLEDKPVFDKHYAKYPPVHSDNLFTTMISWMDYGDYHHALVGDNIVILTKINGKIRFRPPSGRLNLDLSKQVLILAKEEGSEYPLGLIDTKTKDWMSAKIPTLNFSKHRDYCEYVYPASDLADLPGTAFRKIRNRLNKFKKNYASSTEPVTEDNMDEIRQFLKRWCLWKDCESDIFLEHEKKAILYSMSHFFKLGLSGIVVRVQGEIEAISVFEKMSPDTAVVHYEKGSPDYDGIYKFINAEAAKILQKDYRFINRESDMGYPGLRQAKKSYRPHHMVEVFHIAKKDLIF